MSPFRFGRVASGPPRKIHREALTPRSIAVSGYRAIELTP